MGRITKDDLCLIKGLRTEKKLEGGKCLIKEFPNNTTTSLTFNLYKFVPRYMTAGYVPVFRETTDPMTAASGSPALCSSSSTVDALSLPVIRIKPIPQLNVRLISDALTPPYTHQQTTLYNSHHQNITFYVFSPSYF